MNEIKKLGKSFRYAFAGVVWAIKTQRNMRIHLTALGFVLIAGWLEHLSLWQWCVELLCCMAVIAFELLNSALEAACNAVSEKQNLWIGHAKDAAAGAVLVSAVFSLVVGLMIFWTQRSFFMMRIRQYPCVLLLLLLFLVVGLLLAFRIPKRK